MGMTLMLGVGCKGMNQCDPLQASMLTLTLTIGVTGALYLLPNSHRKSILVVVSKLFVLLIVAVFMWIIEATGSIGYFHLTKG